MVKRFFYVMGFSLLLFAISGCTDPNNNEEDGIEKETYQLVFKGIKGEILDFVFVEKGEKVNAPPVPEAEGYTFIGWDNDLQNIDCDMIIKAEFAANDYLVSFDENGGNKIPEVKVKYNLTYRLPIPIRDGYDFLGWETAGVLYTKNIIIKADIHLKAKWEIKTYTVKFRTAYGNVIEQEVKHGNNAMVPSDPIMEGYTFVDWDKKYTNVTSDLFIEAIFNTNQYTLSFDTDYYYSDFIDSITLDYGSPIPELPVLTSSWGVFLGWYEDPWFDSKIDECFILLEDIRLYAKWEPIKFKITYDTDGGEEIEPEFFEIGKSYRLPIPTKEGYRFVGWYLGDDYFGDYIYSIESDLFFKAKWVMVHDGLEIDIALNEAIIIEYKGSKTNLILPDSVSGYPVTKIASNAFRNCSWLESIELGEFIEAIGSYAFSYCSSLKEVLLPENLSSIGENAFYGCRQLREIILPSGLTEIKPGTFYFCEKLESVNIREGVTRIGDGAFTYCSALAEITIPEGVTIIESNTFKGCDGLKEIIIPENITYIGSEAFLSCSSLESITIPEGVTSIGSEAFSNCNELKEITIADSVINIGASAFAFCTSLESVALPKDLTNLDNSLFYYCTSLINIELPNQLETIQDDVFFGCESLKSMILAETVSYLGQRVFALCISLESIILPENVNTIGAGTFGNCVSLKEVTIPKNIKVVENQMFWGCEALDNVVLPDGLAEINDAAFAECISLKSIDLPNTIKRIRGGAFNNCISLETIDLPLNFKHIEANTFMNCYSLRTVKMPEGLLTIGANAFANCISLESITLPEGFYTMYMSAFVNCISLESIIISESTILDSYVFTGCPVLTILCKAEELPETWGYDWNYLNYPVIWGYIAQQ